MKQSVLKPYLKRLSEKRSPLLVCPGNSFLNHSCGDVIGIHAAASNCCVCPLASAVSARAASWTKPRFWHHCVGKLPEKQTEIKTLFYRIIVLFFFLYLKEKLFSV